MANIQPLEGQMKLREAWPIVNENERKMNDEIVDHKASTIAHSAQHITYQGEVSAAGTVKEAIDIQDQRINTIVAGAGESNTEILDARQPATGAPFPILKDRLDASDAAVAEQFGNVDAQLAENTNLISLGGFINKNDLARMKSWQDQNKTVKFAILGDSTKAGVGWRFGPSDTGYAELGDIDKPTSPEMFFLDYMMNSAYFIRPSRELGGAQYFYKKGENSSGATSTNWDRYVCIFTGGMTPALRLSFNHLPTKRDKMVVFFLARTSAGAGAADVVVGGNTYAFDTYVSPVTYAGVNIPQQGMRLGWVEVPIPTDVDAFDMVINNFRQGGAPSPVDGTVNIVGFYYGNPAVFKNWSIRATTLTNNSTRNQGKGVTTDERMQKAYTFGANVFYLGWGTNDVTDGVSVASYGSMLRQRIEEIRAYNPYAVIFLESVYSTATTPVVVDSSAHFAEARKVALEKECSFIDGNEILRKYTKNDVINDYIHQTEYGYKVEGDAMKDMMNVQSRTNASLVRSQSGNPTVYSVNGVASQSDNSGSFAEICRLNINHEKKNVDLLAKIELTSTTDFTDTNFQLIVIGYSGKNQTGTATADMIVDLARFHLVFPAGSVVNRQGSVILMYRGEYRIYESIRVLLTGRNFTLSTAAVATKLTALLV